MSITKEDAEQIAKKLHAVLSPKKNRPHDLYHVYHKGQLITSFGICRSPKKDKGHGHIPKGLFLTPHQTKSMAECAIEEDDWIVMMVKKGVIAE